MNMYKEICKLTHSLAFKIQCLAYLGKLVCDVHVYWACKSAVLYLSLVLVTTKMNANICMAMNYDFNIHELAIATIFKVCRNKTYSLENVMVSNLK